MEPLDLDGVFRIVDVTGVVANGLLGGAVARSRRFDIVGFAMLAIISGLGGGMIRDVLLGAGRPVALTDPAYLSGALIAAVIAYVVRLEDPFSRRALAMADLLALGCWSATGAVKASMVGLGWLPAIMLGVITAVGGGMLRDVLVGKVPAVFGGNTLYASLAVIGSIQAIAFYHSGRSDLGMGVSILTCAVLGVLARRLGWMLPEPIEFNLRWLPTRPSTPKVNIRRLADRLSRRAASKAAPDAAGHEPPGMQGRGEG